MNRRQFLKNAFIVGAGCAIALGETIPASGSSLSTTYPSDGIREALFYKKIDNNTAQCLLCPLMEKVSTGKMSICKVRFFSNGKLYVTNYGKPCAMHLDPVEKNPLYHFHAGMKTLALATAGCNLACPACQNWEMSQRAVSEIKSYNLSPQQAVGYARKNNCVGLSFTFTEPTIFIEYCLDICKLAKNNGLKTCVVTGGYINPEPLELLVNFADSFCISLKGLDEEQYGGSPRPRILETIKNSLKIIKKKGKWLEVAILVIPTKNDDERQMDGIIRWIRDNLGEFTPVHFSRFYPSFQLTNLPQTPVTVLEQGLKMAKKAGIKYAYIGNVPGHVGNNTYCHSCNKLLIQRVGFRVLKNNISEGKCIYCGTRIPGIWT